MKSFFISGRHSVVAALKNISRKKKRLIISKNNTEIENLAKRIGLPIEYKSKKSLDSLFNNQDVNHQNVALEIYPKEEPNENEIYKENEVIILNNINDPRNIGSIIRVAAAFSVKNIIIEKKFFDPKNNYIFKASSGCIESTNIISVVNIKHMISKLKKNYFWIVGFDNHQKCNLFEYEFTKKTAFVFGSEAKGINSSLDKYLDQKIEIPINPLVESLNVSNAVTSVLTYYKIKKL
jgi:23S rRNA (guanosine2251-2'-O)-methyltransferase